MAEKLDDLRVFLLVAETGSFTKAAAQLGVSQSALSYTVRQLEERLKIKLLERTTRSVSTTAAGEQLREQIIPLFAEFDAKIENLAAYRGTLGGSLKITGNEHALTVALWDKFARLPVLTQMWHWNWTVKTALPTSSPNASTPASVLASLSRKT